MNLVERLREDAKAFANRFGADAEKLSIWEAADRLELLEAENAASMTEIANARKYGDRKTVEVDRLRAEITRLQKERDGIDEERRTALALVLERNAQIQALQKELETAREALEGSMSLINRLMHVHVAPDECTSYVEPSRKWLCDNGGTLACIADQQAINRRALKDKEVAG